MSIYPKRELTEEEKTTWGTCPVCLRTHGAKCSGPGCGAHNQRMDAAPAEVYEVPVVTIEPGDDLFRVIPREVHDAEKVITNWFAAHSTRGWEFGGLRSRFTKPNPYGPKKCRTCERKLPCEGCEIYLGLTTGSVQPPLGLRPKWLTDEQRRDELYAVMDRWDYAKAPIPREWEDEFVSLDAIIEQRRKDKEWFKKFPANIYDPKYRTCAGCRWFRPGEIVNGTSREATCNCVRFPAVRHKLPGDTCGEWAAKE